MPAPFHKLARFLNLTQDQDLFNTLEDADAHLTLLAPDDRALDRSHRPRRPDDGPEDHRRHHKRAEEDEGGREHQDFSADRAREPEDKGPFKHVM